MRFFMSAECFLDYKLTMALRLLEHSKAKVLVVDYYLWQAMTQSPKFQNLKAKLVRRASEWTWREGSDGRISSARVRGVVVGRREV